MVFDYTLVSIAVGAAIVGATGGALGCVAVLRRQALLGDALAHAALPGLVAAFLLTGMRATPVLIAGGGLAASLAAWLLLELRRRTRLDPNTALATVLAVFFGVGVVLMSVANKSPLGNQAGLDKMMFGQAAALTLDQAREMAVLGGIALAVAALFFQEITVLAFDPVFGEMTGRSERRVGLLSVVLLVLAILICLPTVGVVLTSAVLVAPAVAVRPWVKRLAPMMVWSGVLGAVSGVGGAVLSVEIPNLPTGPVIVIIIGLLAGMSQIAALAKRSRRKRLA